MVIDLKPETERRIKEELSSGHFRSLDEIILQGIESRVHAIGPLARRPLMTAEQRAASYRNWYRNLPRNEVAVMDDSREAIYGDHP